MSAKAMFAKVRRWWTPRCDVEGCDEPAFFSGGPCHGHLSGQRDEFERREAERKFERDVAVHLEALRRFDAEKVEPSSGSRKR